MSSRLSILFIMMLLTSLLVGQFVPVQAMPDLATSCIYRVKSGATGKGDGSTWFDAYPTLQPAINTAAVMAATMGTTCEVWVSQGTYSPGPLASDSFVMKNNVAIYGHFAGSETERSQRRFIYHSGMGPEPDTILSGGGVNYHVVKNAQLDRSAVLDHVTISGGHANGSVVADQNGAGMYNEGGYGPTLSYLIFSGNTADGSGGGMYNTACSPALMEVMFASNSALSGGGMYNTNDSGPYLLDVTFSLNTAQTGGGIYSNGGFTGVANSIFSGNSAQSMGGAIYAYGGRFFLGTSTVAGNTSPLGSVILSANTSPGGIYNSIIWGNTGQLSSNSIIQNSLVEGCMLDGQWRDLCGTNGGGNLQVDPRFVDGNGPDNLYGTADDNFRLQSASPVINQGNKDDVAGDWFDLDHDNLPNDPLPYDLDGSPRVSGGQVDMGAHEFNLIYVDRDATGANDGTSWGNAYKSLTSALTAAPSGSEIWVAEGRYSPGTADTNMFMLKNKVTLYGGFVGNETERSQRNWIDHASLLWGNHFTKILVYGDDIDTSAVLDGFTITGSYNTYTMDGSGAIALYNSSPTLANLTITGNVGQYNGGGLSNYGGSPTLINVTFSGNSLYGSGGGGAMYNETGGPTLINVTFTGNTAQNGGGLDNNHGNPVLINVVFSGNTAAGKGGGIYNDWGGSPTLTNVTMSDNTALDGGGLYNAVSSDFRIRNSIFWDNSGGAVTSLSGKLSFTHSLVQGCILSGTWQCGTDGGGNLDTDPLFVDADGDDNIAGNGDDDLSLQLTSTARDAADPSLLPVDQYDIDQDGDTAEPLPYDRAGSLRTVGSLDMGAYEIPLGIVEGDEPLTYTILEDQPLSPVQLHLNLPSATPAWTIASAAAQGTASVSSSGLVSYTPDHNANGSDTFTVQVINAELTDTITFNLTITPVNDVPSFQASSEVAVNEDSGPYATAWASQIKPGPADEQQGGANVQTLTGFTVMVPPASAGLFKTPPAVDVSTGILTFEPAADANGTVIVQVTLQDSSDTRNGGVNSVSQPLTITIHPVNDAPSFTAGGDISVAENSGSYSAAWATGLLAGPVDERPGGINAQAFLNFSVNVPDASTGLFQVQPALSTTGILTFTPAHNANGRATVTVSLQDNGGISYNGVDTSAEQTFTITIGPVNDAPSFKASSAVTVDEDSGAYAALWATEMSPGPADEQPGGANAQTLASFSVDVPAASTGLFEVLPAVDVATGVLTFKPAANANGSVTLTVTLKDNGGKDNGGVDSASQDLILTITPVNDAPAFTKGGNIVMKVNSGAYTAAWATELVMGPADEQPGGANAQTAGFIIDSNTNPALFQVPPSLDASGILSFTPAKDATGSAEITVYLKDSGGTSSGVDVSGKVTFTIQVAPEIIYLPCVIKGGQ